MTRSRQASTILPAHTLSIKGKNLIRLFAVCMLLSGMLTMLARPVAAHVVPERIDGNTYNGLDYGWSLNWDDAVWTDPYEEHVDGTEYISLETVGEPAASARIVATNMFDGDVDACVTGWEDVLRDAGSLRHIKATEVPSGIDLADGAAEGAYTYNVKVHEVLVDVVEYVQCQPFSDGVNLVLTLAVVSDVYEDALPLFTDLVDGISLEAPDMASDSSDSAHADDTNDAETGDRPNSSHDSASVDVPGGSGVDGNTYTSVNFDWSVEWDASMWKTQPDWEDNSAGNDYFPLLSTGLDAPVMGVEFETTVRYDGNTAACSEGEMITLKSDPEISDVTEANVDLPEVADGASVVAYTYTLDDNQGDPLEMIELQECMVLDNDGALLQVRMVIIPRLYDEALPYFVDLTDAIIID